MSINSIGSNIFMRPHGDPDAYAKQYAAQKGITLEEAKEELKRLYGNPQGPNNGQGMESSSSIGNQNNNNGYVGLGFNENDNVDRSGSVPGMNPDGYAAMYAYQNGMEIDEAKEELKKKYGNPQRLNLIG